MVVCDCGNNETKIGDWISSIFDNTGNTIDRTVAVMHEMHHLPERDTMYLIQCSGLPSESQGQALNKRHSYLKRGDIFRSQPPRSLYCRRQDSDPSARILTRPSAKTIFERRQVGRQGLIVLGASDEIHGPMMTTPFLDRGRNADSPVRLVST